jgi:hypothetical protein
LDLIFGPAKAKINLHYRGRRSTMPMADDLGNLILNLDPYTHRHIRDTGLRVGRIDVYCRQAPPPPLPQPPPPPPPAVAIPNISYEVDGPYAQDWIFRNQPLKIGMAIRICVRYEIIDANGNSSWVEDYLLVGYGGGMGG